MVLKILQSITIKIFHRTGFATVFMRQALWREVVDTHDVVDLIRIGVQLDHLTPPRVQPHVE